MQLNIFLAKTVEDETEAKANVAALKEMLAPYPGITIQASVSEVIEPPVID